MIYRLNFNRTERTSHCLTSWLLVSPPVPLKIQGDGIWVTGPQIQGKLATSTSVAVKWHCTFPPFSVESSGVGRQQKLETPFFGICWYREFSHLLEVFIRCVLFEAVSRCDIATAVHQESWRTDCTCACLRWLWSWGRFCQVKTSENCRQLEWLVWEFRLNKMIDYLLETLTVGKKDKSYMWCCLIMQLQFKYTTW